MIKFTVNKNLFRKIAFTISLSAILGAGFLSPHFTRAEDVPNEFKRCIPSVISFKVNPLKLTSRDQAPNATVIVRSIGCIISPINGNPPLWSVFVNNMDDNGNYYADGLGWGIPKDGYIRPSDFVRVNNNTQSPDYNKYDATYTVGLSGMFEGQTGTTITLVPNLQWHGSTIVDNTGLAVKVTAPALTGTDPKTTVTCKYTGTALSKAALIKAIKDKKPTAAELTATIKKSGVDFAVTAEVDKELATAGVPAALIKLAKENPRSSCDTATDPSGAPSNVNTNVGATFIDLDENIGTFDNLLTHDTLPELLGTILRILFALIGMVAVVIIIIAGFRMVLASGNESALTAAKKSITWAIIGLIVSLMSFSIVAIIQKLIQG